MLGQGALAAEVAFIHGAELGHGDMAFVDEDQRVVGHVFKHGGGRLAGLAAGEIARIVLDPHARTGRLEHFKVELGALLQALGLQQLAVGLHPFKALGELFLDADNGLVQRRARGDIVRVRVDADLLKLADRLAGEGVEFLDGLDLVAEKADAPGAGVIVGGEDLQHVAAQTKRAALEGGVVSCVLQRDEVAHDLAGIFLRPHLQIEYHGGVGLHRADAVNARHRGDDDDVVALQDRAGGGVAHPVDGLVDGGLLLDEGVGARHIGFGLVVVVVGDEILHRIMGKIRLELAVQLRRQGFVRRQDQSGTLNVFNHFRHGESLAGAGDSEENLVLLRLVDPLHQLRDRMGLVAGGFVIGHHLEFLPPLRFVGTVGAVRGPVRRQAQRILDGSGHGLVLNKIGLGHVLDALRGEGAIITGQLGHGGNMGALQRLEQGVRSCKSCLTVCEAMCGSRTSISRVAKAPCLKAVLNEFGCLSLRITPTCPRSCARFCRASGCAR